MRSEPPTQSEAPRVDDALGAGRAELDDAQRRALAALERAQADGADATAHADAARALVNVADLSIQVALVERGRAAEADDARALVRGEDALGSDLRDAVEGLLRAAALHARAALAVDPERLGARHDEAFAESLTAWAIGPTRALVSGAGRRLPKLLAANRALGPFREGAAPTRLEGRFLCMAPWPMGDIARGRALLDEAAAHTPSPINTLFQGDAAWSSNDLSSARAAWRVAATGAAQVDPYARLVGELALLRLAASER